MVSSLCGLEALCIYEEQMQGFMRPSVAEQGIRFPIRQQAGSEAAGPCCSGQVLDEAQSVL